MNLIIVLYEWQTLVAGLLALGAAWWTVKHLKEQINLQREALEDDKRRYEDSQLKKQLAARAALPDALADIYRYGVKCAEYYSNLLLTHAGIETVPDSCTQLPEPPYEATIPIKTSIEYLDPLSIKRMTELTNWFQILNARHGDEDPSKHSISQGVFDSMKLCGLAERLFKFARQPEESVPTNKITRDEIEKYFFLLLRWSDRKRDIFKGVEGKIAASFSDED